MNISISPATVEVSDSVGVDKLNQAHDDWLSAFPEEFTLLRNLLQSKKWLNITIWFYAGTSIVLIFFYIFRLYDEISSGEAERNILQFLLDRIQDVAYLMMPYLTYYYFVAFYTDPDIPVLFSRAVAMKPSLRVMIVLLFRFNITFITVAFITFAIYEGNVFEKVYSSFYSVFYIYPFCFAYSLSVCLMMAHKAHADELCSVVKKSRCSLDNIICNSDQSDCSSNLLVEVHSDDVGTGVELHQLYVRYRQLHAMCLKTSERRGPYLFLMHVFAIVFAVATVWSIYTGSKRQIAAVGYFLITVAFILQLGLVVTAANEAGHIACRELSTYVISRQDLFKVTINGGNNAAMLLIGCMSYAKLEVLFFGNFALRSHHLAAIVGTLIGTVIPATLYGVSF